MSRFLVLFRFFDYELSRALKFEGTIRVILQDATVIAAEDSNWVSFSSYHMINFLFARLSSSQPCKWGTRLGFLDRNASLIFKSFSSAVEVSESPQREQKQGANESFKVSYLINSWGLSPKAAIDVAKRCKLKDPDKVLNLFRNYGFSDTQISQIVKVRPCVLGTNFEKFVLPKLMFFESIGISRSELPQLLISNCRLLTWSLKERIIPGYEALKSVVDDNERMDIIRKPKLWEFLHSDVKNVVPNMKLLRELGAPQSSVNLLLKRFSGLASVNHAKFIEHVEFVKDIGIEPSKSRFIQCIYLLSLTKKSSWESKLEVYERCGWSRDVTLSAFRKFPFCMGLSEEKITSTMKFLVDEMGLSSKYIAKYPAFLGYSLKHRIIPRCSVFKVLKMKGLINNDMTLYPFISVGEKIFLEKFVIRFQESVPELLKIYPR